MIVVMQTHDTTRAWREVVTEQGRSLRWLALATGKAPRTVYAYSRGQLPAPAEWLARVSVVLGEEVTR